MWKVGVKMEDGADAAGFNYTNRIVSVKVTAIDGELDPGVKVRMEIRDRTGDTVASVDRELNGTGVYAFDTAEDPSSTLCAGMNYDYEIKLVDAAGGEIVGTEAPSGAFRTATDANWFSASAKDDSLVGGTWQTKPEVKDGAYVLTSGTTYRLEPTVSRNGILQVTTEARFHGGYPEELLAALCERHAAKPPQSALTVKEKDDESFVWAGLVRGKDGPTYKELFGPTPDVEKFCLCRQEVDYTRNAPHVSYLVADSNGSFVRLADSTGETWFPGPDAGGTQVSAVELEGSAAVSEIVGQYADGSVVRIDGKKIVLLTNVIFDSTTLEPGDYTVDQGGHAFRWTDGGGRSAAYDGKAGAFKVCEGAPKNGCSSYESYVLNMDPEDADSKPVATFVRDEATGKMKVRLMLANGKPFAPRSSAETGVEVNVALESADNVRFDGSQTGERCSPDKFEPVVDTTGPSGFFRCHIILGQ